MISYIFTYMKFFNFIFLTWFNFMNSDTQYVIEKRKKERK